MPNWREYCDNSTLEWLLEPALPPVCYLALTQLLDRPAEDPEAAAARSQAMTTPPVSSLLRHWRKGGRWAGERGYYTHKYKSTHWQLLLLAELNADGSDPRIAQACERMLHDTGGPHTDVYPCFHGNLIGYQATFGHAGDERLRARTLELSERAITGGTARLAQRQTPLLPGADGRWADPWWCTINDGLPCAWGAARALWGLARLPEAEQSPEVHTAIDSAVQFLATRGRLEKGDYPASGKAHSLWGALNFPLMYQADVLFTLRALADAGRAHEPAFRPAIDWLLAKRGPNGRWRGRNPFQDRMWARMEPKGRYSKWVTLQALYIFKHALDAPAHTVGSP